jgi:hypothetical protein
MSTRGCIARKTKDGFSGVFHHWDSYPSGLGEALWKLYHKRFNKNLDEMLKSIIDEHPEGFISIIEDRFEPYEDKMSDIITQENMNSHWCEYAYVFDDKSMIILDSKLRPMAIIDLDGHEPDWEKLDKSSEYVKVRLNA